MPKTLSDSEIFALLGRIHVLMRRTLNRITDVDYMRDSRDYAREIVRLGEATDNQELQFLCMRLREALQLDEVAAPVVEAPPPPKKYLFTLR